MFSIYVFWAYVENISSEWRYALLFFPHVENIRNRTCSIPYVFFISFGQSEESSNEVNCFFTDNAKILISELYHYSMLFSLITLYTIDALDLG